MFYATKPKGWYEVVGKWLTMKGYGRKRRSFGEINQMVIFSGKSFKRDFLQKKQIYGKDSESLPFFFNKDIEISKQGFIKQKSILLFFNKDIEFSKQT